MRLFWAAPLAGAEILAGVRDNLAACGADVKWVRPDHYHLTLAFIGHVDESSLAAVTAVGREALEGFRGPIAARLGPLGAFPDWRQPKVLWAAVDENGALTRAAESLYNVLSRAGFRLPERPFVPHVTLGRVRSRKGLAPLLERSAPWREDEAWDGAAGRIDELVLYESRLSQKGPEYAARFRFPL